MLFAIDSLLNAITLIENNIGRVVIRDALVIVLLGVAIIGAPLIRARSPG